MTNYVWFGGSGNWSDTGDWSPHGVPNGSTAAVAITSGNVTVSNSYSIGGHFDLGSATITGNSGTLNIDGSDNIFSGSSVDDPALITGTLSIIINGTSTFDYLTISGGANVTNQSTINEENRVTIGNSTGKKATLINAAPGTGQPGKPDPGGTYILEGSAGIVAGSASARFDNYGTFIKAGGIGTSGIGVNFTDTGTIIISEGTLAFYNSASFSGSITGPGELLLEGGTSQDPNIQQTLANANIDVYAVVMAGPTAATKTNPAYAADSLEVTANTACSSVFTEEAGASLTIDPGVKLTLTGGPTLIGTTSLSGTISGGGTLAFANGSQSLEGNVALDGPTLSISGSDTLTIDTSLTDSHTFTQASGMLVINANDILTLTGTATFAGTVTGGGTLNLAGGSQSLNKGASLDISNLTMSGSDKLTVNAPVSYVGTLTQGVGTTLAVDSSLDFQGTNTLSGTTTLNDAGTITVENGALYITSTGILDSIGTSTASLMIANGSGPRHGRGTISAVVMNSGKIKVGLSGLDVSGLLKNIKNGNVFVGASTSSKSGNISATGTSILSLDSGGTSTAGAFTVASNGLLDFAGGTFNLTGGASAAADTITGGGQVNLTGGTLELAGSTIAIACQFSQSAGSVLDGTGTLTLTQAVGFTDDGGTAVESGVGKTLLESATTVSGNLALDGGRTLENAKTLTWAAGDFYLGIDPLGVTVGSGTIMNDAGAAFDMESDGVVARGAGMDTFINAGTVTKSSQGTTTIATAFANLANGVVDVKTGTLDLAGAVRGTGKIEVDGGALEVDTTLTQNQQVMFTPQGGSLALTDASSFLGYITDFGKNKQDAIDLIGPGFGVPGAAKTTKLSYAGNSTEGVLTITDGKLRANLVLFGDYVAAGFHTSPHSGGGTVINYVQPSPGHLELAAGH